MKIRTIAVVSTMCLVVSCKKSEPAPTGAASGAPLQAAPGAAPAAAPGSFAGFEGDVTLLAKSKKEHQPMPPITLTVKGTNMRFDVPEGLEGAPRLGLHTYAIVNTAEKKMYMVVDEQKMVMVMDLDHLAEQMKKTKAPGGSGEAANEPPPKVTKTGHMDTVAGMSCEDWELVSAKGRGRVCVSGEEASWLSMPSLGLPTEHLWAKELFDGKHLPLRMVGYDAAGAEENRLEVTKLERKPVPETTFAIPKGYRMMDFSQMMAGMQGMMNGMMGGAHGTAGMASGLPPGMKLPANAAEMMKEIQERAKAAGIKPPPPQ